MKSHTTLSYSLLGVLFLAAACGGKTKDVGGGPEGAKDKQDRIEADAGGKANAVDPDSGRTATSGNDLDEDGIVDEEDEDIDGDGVVNEKDGDLDGDGIINEQDEDLDGDGIDNVEDNDIDGDGIVNAEDDDVDGDGILNEEDDNVTNLVTKLSDMPGIDSMDETAPAQEPPIGDGAEPSSGTGAGATGAGATGAGATGAGATGAGATGAGATGTGATGAGATGGATREAVIGTTPDEFYGEEFYEEVSINLAPIDIPEGCTQEYLYASTNGCEMGLSCESRYSDGYCYISEIDDAGAETWSCGCSGEDYTAFSVGGTTAEELCPVALGLCAAGEVPQAVAPDAEPVCATQYREASADWCNVNVVCSEEANVGDSLIVKVQDNKESYCDRVGDDDWRCSCNESGSYLQFNINDVAEPLDVCIDVREMCDAGTIEGDGDITCKPQSVSGGDNYCSASVRCTQSGQLGGSTVESLGSAGVYCDLASGEDWQCECYDSVDSFTVSGSDGFEVCLSALEPCEAAVIESGVLTNSSGGYGGGYDLDY